MRGAISAFDGKSLSVKAADGKAVDIEVTDKVEIVFNQPIKLADIKSGDFLASHVHEARGWQPDRLRGAPLSQAAAIRDTGRSTGKSDQTMTNASVSAMVQSANGQRADADLRRRLPEDRRAGERRDIHAGPRPALAARSRRAVNLTAAPARAASSRGAHPGQPGTLAIDPVARIHGRVSMTIRQIIPAIAVSLALSYSRSGASLEVGDKAPTSMLDEHAVGKVQAFRRGRQEERRHPVLRPRLHPDVNQGTVVQ